MKTAKIIWIVLFSICLGCPVLADQPKPLKELSEMTSNIKAQQDKEKSEAMANQVRYDAIKQAGTTVAIQTAVKYRYDQLNKKMESMATSLNKLDFSLLLIHSGKVLPPLIREADKTLRLESDNHSVSSQHVYQIFQREKIVINTPTWRQYMIKEFETIEEVHPLLLPQNSEEQAIWKAGVNKGWELGIQQANNEFYANWNRFVRDFIGAITYHRLALQGVVSVPKVAEGKYGIRINDKTLDIDQREFRITGPTQFNEADKWTPIIYTQKTPASGSETK